MSGQGIVQESSYEREAGVEPVKITTLRGLRKRAKRGLFDEEDNAVWADCVVRGQ
ncbi:hypothetical protein [Curtobacterium caseinilyticum]|uniref:Uncharacterized protein n=1 Tax=Curtobacterium caseinilyticum TaxID=3055137 RepID=A0ABT7TTU0_9MICO|nr:hypothetical protein [Curtobacterium caseinilyticum]MDM7893037.1 hypothetical protein [Curtobacterium caseinilyticum]